jgi:hypothetical protein
MYKCGIPAALRQHWRPCTFHMHVPTILLLLELLVAGLTVPSMQLAAVQVVPG